MEIRFSVKGAERKAMAETVGRAIGAEVQYLGVPTFSYRVGGFEITKDGSLVYGEEVESKLTDKVLAALADAGYTSEDALQMEEEQEEGDENYAPIVSLPRELFSEEALANLDALLASKENLICKALGIEDTSYELSDSFLTFSWFYGAMEPEKAKAYIDFVGKLCEMARRQKRVTAKPKAYANEKYAFRCFLLRLGLIGKEYKMSRKVLLKNLSGNASWRDGNRKESEHHEISEPSGA